MKYRAVIDTNVLVSALLAKNEDSAPVKVLDAVFDGVLIPLYCKDILAEYDEVFHREKFKLHDDTIRKVLAGIKRLGIWVNRRSTGAALIDSDDLVFYETAAAKRDEGAYLITGNQKHYPEEDFIITPAQMLRIINNNEI